MCVPDRTGKGKVQGEWWDITPNTLEQHNTAYDISWDVYVGINYCPANAFIRSKNRAYET